MTPARRRLSVAFGTVLLVLVSACASAQPTSSAPRSAHGVAAARAPRPTVQRHTRNQPRGVHRQLRWQHVVIVVEENHSFDVLRDRAAGYFRHLARTGLDLTRFHAETHPSEPNYLALFAGRTFVSGDQCPTRLDTRNIARELVRRRMGFAGYSEGLPHSGYRGCASGAYVRRHAPWTNFANVSERLNKPFRAFPHRLSRLPRLSFVIPNLNHDMHDGTPRQANNWLRRRLGHYVHWSRTHHSLFVLTFDESDWTQANHIPTMLVGQGVRHRRSAQRANHYNLLRTIEDGLSLPPLGHARSATPIRFPR